MLHPRSSDFSGVILEADITPTKDEDGSAGLLANAALNELPNTPGEVITFVREWRPVGGDDEHYVHAIAL